MSTSAETQDLSYLYASNANVSNFVSEKLSGNNNYHVWRSQMLCLLDSNNMGGIVEDTFAGPRYSSTDTLRQYDSLARGWILGSVSGVVLADVHNLSSAKDVWEKLKSIYDPQDSTSDAVEERENSIEIIVDQDIVPTITDSHKYLGKLATNGHWSLAEGVLKRYKVPLTVAVDTDGNTMLHIAVGRGHKDFVKQLLLYMSDEHLLQPRDSDGSTSLHIAAIVGNTHAADLLVKRNKNLLRVKDKKGVEPLQKAYEYMHLDTVGYLLKAINDDGETMLQSVHRDDDITVDLLVNAISAKQYSLALELVPNFRKSASRSGDVLMALAKNFPSELDYWEKLVYPSLYKLLKRLAAYMILTLTYLGFPAFSLIFLIASKSLRPVAITKKHIGLVIILTVPAMLASPFAFAYFLIMIVYFPFSLLYYLLWKGANRLAFAPIKRIENKKKNLEEAVKVLPLVCDEIDKLENSGDQYSRSILEAACQNAYEVVHEIIRRSPKAIESKDKSGYDIIQIAILNRSEQVYNLIYDIGERKNLYRIYKDFYGNNILHLAGRLAPSSVLNQRTGAALQVQRELQWHEEVKNFVFPTYIKEENIFKETPDMVFTREHENLVKEGEKWMKSTAESCSITAALITTIVFAAAITVPGGSDQEKGTPLFKKESAFIIFAISDAISLFASSTALLVFLSILTTRFAEKDFLVSLPRRLFIGLFSLLLSTTTMMIAFGATLFLVFCDKKLWMLIPIGGLAFIPIASFVTLQFPLMVDLIRSTYLPIFGNKKKSPIMYAILEMLIGILLR